MRSLQGEIENSLKNGQELYHTTVHYNLSITPTGFDHIGSHQATVHEIQQ